MKTLEEYEKESNKENEFGRNKECILNLILARKIENAVKKTINYCHSKLKIIIIGIII